MEANFDRNDKKAFFEQFNINNNMSTFIKYPINKSRLFWSIEINSKVSGTTSSFGLFASNCDILLLYSSSIPEKLIIELI